MINEINIKPPIAIKSGQKERNKRDTNNLKTNCDINLFLSSIVLSDSQISSISGNIGTSNSSGLRAKLKQSDDYIPTIHNYKELADYNLTVPFLKNIARKNKLGLTNNKKQKKNLTKDELLNKIYVYFHYTYNTIKIQKIYRGYLQRRLIKLQGPGLKNRNNCTNSTDFITLENITEIPTEYFYSYEANKETELLPILSSKQNESIETNDTHTTKTHTKELYGFNINSIYQYVIKQKKMKNPYNRDKLPLTIKKDIELFIRLNKIIGNKIILTYPDDTKEYSVKQQLELRALSLFQTINELDNYSDVNWFLNLSRDKTLTFLREFYDIWNYRAQLCDNTKRELCPPDGNLFRNININNIYLEQDVIKIKNTVLKIFEKLMYNTDTLIENKKLNAIYILSALTLVSNNAANAMPMYYFSVIG